MLRPMLTLLSLACLTTMGWAEDAVIPPAPNRTPASGKELEAINTQIHALSSDSFEDREKAEAALRKAGPAALEALNTALKQTLEPEAKARVRRIADDVKEERWDGFLYFSDTKDLKDPERFRRFSMTVTRDEKGNLEAVCLENPGSGTVEGARGELLKSTVTGHVDIAKSQASFKKSFDSNMNYTFNGLWNPKVGCLEGFYDEGPGPLNTRIVIFPRKMSAAEIQALDLSLIRPKDPNP